MEERTMSRLKWIFNPQMVWGAILGLWLFGSLWTIQDEWRHQAGQTEVGQADLALEEAMPLVTRTQKGTRAG